MSGCPCADVSGGLLPLIIASTSLTNPPGMLIAGGSLPSFNIAVAVSSFWISELPDFLLRGHQPQVFAHDFPHFGISGVDSELGERLFELATRGDLRPGTL